MENNNKQIIVGDAFGETLIRDSKYHVNTSQDFILTTEDKLRLNLIEFSDVRHAKSGWIAPMTLFITLLAVLATASFQPLIFSPDTWKAIFIILTLGSAIWTVHSFFRMCVKCFGVDELILKLKRESVNLDKEK